MQRIGGLHQRARGSDREASRRRAGAGAARRGRRTLPWCPSARLPPGLSTIAGEYCAHGRGVIGGENCGGVVAAGAPTGAGRSTGGLWSQGSGAGARLAGRGRQPRAACTWQKVRASPCPQDLNALAEHLRKAMGGSGLVGLQEELEPQVASAGAGTATRREAERGSYFLLFPQDDCRCGGSFSSVLRQIIARCTQAST